MRKPLVFAPLLLGLVFTAPAHADPAGFDNYMQTHGYSNPVGMNGVNYLSQAQLVCSVLRSGQSESPLTSALESKLSIAESGLGVSGAHQFLCPDA
jgi:hypothetical protein